MKYIIYGGIDFNTAEYCEKVGGSVVLYHLGKKLKKKGQDVYMLCKKTIEDLPKIDLDDVERMKHDSWIIYPESIWGNPLNVNNVVRWILFDPERIGNPNTWHKDDLIYKFCEYFKVKDIKHEDGYLRINDFKLNIFYNKNLNNRNLDCHLLRKYVGEYIIYHSNVSKCLDNNNYTLNEIAEIFNKTNIFISYDDATYYSIMAALCGATSIIIPNPKNNISKEDYIKRFPIFKYGVAYGMNDIEWAKNTKHLVKDYLIELDRESDVWLDNFIENTHKKFKK